MNPVTPYVLPLLGGLVAVALLLVAAHLWDVGAWPVPGAGRTDDRRDGTRGAWVKVPLFTLALVWAFVWSGDVVTSAAGGGHGPAALPAGVSVAAGEQIFWGVGKCHTCHSVGTRGGKIRGPNLGGQPGVPPAAPATDPASHDIAAASEPPGPHSHEPAPEPHGAHSHAPGEAIPPIGLHAQDMADERAKQLGHPMTGTEYLVESIANPSAFVTQGYKDEMPKVYLPPISLTADQITSVILYLQSLGGTPDPAAIHLPPEILQAAGTRAPAETWKPYLPGDSARGHQLFFDLKGPAGCAKCHRVGDQGGNVGPELTSVAGTRTPQYIVESILDPGKDIATGYETVQLHLKGGRTLEGVVRRETPDSLWVGTAEGRLVAVPAASVEHRAKQDVSLMPADFAKKINVKDFHDLLAFLESLQPLRPGGDSARGRELFFDVAGRAACAKCHRVGSQGGDAGPELTTVVGIRSPQFILESILEPNKHIASGYETVQIQTREGRRYEGVVVRRTSESILLGTADGQHVSLPLSGIAQQRVLGTSLMPDTLAKELSPKDLSDLMAYLATLR